MYQKTAHPADDARMRAILLALKKLDYANEAKQIELKWNEFKVITKQKPSPEYLTALPDALLEKACEHCYAGIKAIDCLLASRTNGGQFFNWLNSSWETFWKNPNEFGPWEKEQVKKLKASI